MLTLLQKTAIKRPFGKSMLGIARLVVTLDNQISSPMHSYRPNAHLVGDLRPFRRWKLPFW